MKEGRERVKEREGKRKEKEGRELKTGGYDERERRGGEH